MKLILALAGLVNASRIAWDANYNSSSSSLNTVSCSDGVNGLISRYAWQTLKDVPSFPHVGAIDSIGGWNSAACGNCYKITWKGRELYFTAIDHADNGAALSERGLDDLTDGHAIEYGAVDADITLVEKSFCGVP